MATLEGTFPDSGGVVQTHARAQVGVTRDRMLYHLTIDDVGRGSITMGPNAGIGRFRLLNDELLDIVAIRAADGLRYRILRRDNEIAKGIIRDLPP